MALMGEAGLTAMILVLVMGPFVIPLLHRLKFGQSIRQEGPKAHYKKSGTPTMGGLMLILAVTAAVLAWGGTNREIWLALFVMIGYGFIGFIDDFIKVVLKRNLGLTARQKLFGQVVIAVMLAYTAAEYFGLGTYLWIPIWNERIELGPLYYVFILFLLVGTTNAVNLTDGLDGLAAGTSLVAAAAFAVVALSVGKMSMAVFCAGVVGACLGFLRFNKNPARIFMGDTGSLALGAALAVAAVITKTELLLVVIGGVFVVETLSVIIQVISFKTTGKRVFRMSPIHHHFELGGWPETKVVKIFCLAGVFCAILGLFMLVVKSGGI